MSLREEVKILLSEGRYDELVNKALHNQGVIKYLLRLLYHPYGAERWWAIEGLGRISEAMEKTDPDAVRELIRRLLWSMNDESGTASWSAPEAVGEIIFRSPERFKEFISIVVYASEEEIFHRGIAWVLGRVGQVRPELVQEFIPLLIKFLNNPRPEVRAYSAWSLGQIGVKEALPKLKELVDEQSLIEVYEEGKVHNKSVHQLVEEAISNIEKME